MKKIFIISIIGTIFLIIALVYALTNKANTTSANLKVLSTDGTCEILNTIAPTEFLVLATGTASGDNWNTMNPANEILSDSDITCANLNDEDLCAALDSCSWATSCSGSLDCSIWNGYGLSSDCLAHSLVCQEQGFLSCSGSCADCCGEITIYGQGACEATNFCSWDIDTSNCIGNRDCSGYITEFDCIAHGGGGCVLNGYNCANNGACSDLLTEINCNDYYNCAWGGTCSGTVTEATCT